MTSFGVSDTWIIVLQFVVLLPVSFLVCGPLFRGNKHRWKAIFWYSIMQISFIGFGYFFSDRYRFLYSLIALLWVLASLSGLAAAKFRWHLGKRSKRLFSRIAEGWMKLLDHILEI
jgi:predicted membrane protein